MITAGLPGGRFRRRHTDAQRWTMSKAQRIVQMGTQVTQGLGRGFAADVGARGAQEGDRRASRPSLRRQHGVVTAGMEAGPARVQRPHCQDRARNGILTVGVVTKPFHFEGQRRMRTAEAGIAELHKVVDTLLIIPNQNLFRVANERPPSSTPSHGRPGALLRRRLHHRPMVKEGLDQPRLRRREGGDEGKGKAMMGTGEAPRQARADRGGAAIAIP